MSVLTQWAGVALVFLAGALLDVSIWVFILCASLGVFLLVSEFSLIKFWHREAIDWRAQANYWRNQWQEEQTRRERIARDCRIVN